MNWKTVLIVLGILAASVVGFFAFFVKRKENEVATPETNGNTQTTTNTTLGGGQSSSGSQTTLPPPPPVPPLGGVWGENYLLKRKERITYALTNNYQIFGRQITNLPLKTQEIDVFVNFIVLENITDMVTLMRDGNRQKMETYSEHLRYKDSVLRAMDEKTSQIRSRERAPSWGTSNAGIGTMIWRFLSNSCNPAWYTQNEPFNKWLNQTGAGNEAKSVWDYAISKNVLFDPKKSSNNQNELLLTPFDFWVIFLYYNKRSSEYGIIFDFENWLKNAFGGSAINNGWVKLGLSEPPLTNYEKNFGIN